MLWPSTSTRKGRHLAIAQAAAQPAASSPIRLTRLR